MTSTSTYTFDPSAGDLVVHAFGMIQLRRTDLTAAHLADAAMAFNLLSTDIANRTPNFFTLETQSFTLVAGTSTYTMAARTISCPVVYIDTTSGTVTTSRVIGGASNTEYASIPNKAQTGAPTTFYYALLKTPTITVWPVPDSATTYTMNCVTFCQTQDIDLTAGYTTDLPYRYLEAVTTGLAARLAELYKPELADILNARYEMRMNRVAMRDQEDVPLYISPGLQSYFR